ncbi:hypothetical protein A3K86_06560 [Photobacterium jeanii]|uniref:Porin n=1 Tax=Photobacterium jeanii TaxID=858640 RepID=A0A178KNJ6_9GAMM|nr:hypothetical protein [Photobacterium jeanii]OAN18545.1 hypothetical protein A3K86_06560 [Photobacterium jeanii]PST91773.1 hypothetical protein C9I91_00910 [Photobacterium jeanii]
MTMKAFRLLPLAALCAVSAQVAASTTTDARISDLENQVAVLTEQQQSSVADRFQFDGFASLNLQTANNGAGYAGATNKLNLDEGSLIGLQSVFTVNDTTSATVQLVSRGTELENWKPQIEWAFISHEFTPNLKGRAGKLRLPLFMLSDYLEVGYAQLGVRVPNEVYGNVVATSFTGADMLYDIELEDSSIMVQGFAGSHNLSSDKTKFRAQTKFDQIYGGALSWTNDTLTLRASYAQAKVSSNDNWLLNGQPLASTTFNDDPAKFYGIGARFDGENLFVMSEITRTETQGFYPDADAAYVTLGYRVESVTPYITVSHLKTKDNDVRKKAADQAMANLMKKPTAAAMHQAVSTKAQQAVLDMQRTSYSVGARWDVYTNMALKADVTYVTDFGDTRGGLPGAAKDKAIDDTLVYTVKLDVVF